MRRFPATLSIAALGTIATHALAQEAPVPQQETVVTATRVPTPVVNIPAGVTVIGRQTIEQRD